MNLESVIGSLGVAGAALFVAGCGMAQADEAETALAAAVEACEQWRDASVSGDGTGGKNRAIEAARGAATDERFRYLATDMTTYRDAQDRFDAVDLEGESLQGLDAGVLEAQEFVEAMEAMNDADDSVLESCDAVGVDLGS